MSNEEVVAVLGHELGHWALSHTLVNLIVTELNLLLMLTVFAYFYKLVRVIEVVLMCITFLWWFVVICIRDFWILSIVRCSLFSDGSCCTRRSDSRVRRR